MAELPPKARAGIAKAAAEIKNLAGITLPARYDDLTQRGRAAAREAYVEEQGGLCYHCKHELNGNPPDEIMSLPIDWTRFPGGRSFLTRPVHLHHCHRTGLTIGAVHALCNAVLWQYHGE